MIEALKWTGIIIAALVLAYILWRIFTYGLITSYFQAKILFIQKLKELKKGGE